jgi:hypothetical protein
MLGLHLLTAAEFVWDEWCTNLRGTMPTDDNRVPQIPPGFFSPSSSTGSQPQAPATCDTAQPRTSGNEIGDGLSQGLVKASVLQGERIPDSLADIELHNLTRAACANIH